MSTRVVTARQLDNNDVGAELRSCGVAIRLGRIVAVLPELGTVHIRLRSAYSGQVVDQCYPPTARFQLRT